MAVLIRNANPSDHATIVQFNRQMALETEDKTLDAKSVAAGFSTRVTCAPSMAS